MPEELMRCLAFVAIAAVFTFTGAPQHGWAETSDDVTATEPTANNSPDNSESRYTFSRVQDGFLRLDNRTGHVSLCSKRAVGWGCQLVPEDRGAFENEIARLQDENAALKRDLLARGLPLPGSVKPDPDTARRDPAFKMPSDAQVERMRSIIESAWRRLVEMISNLQRDVLKKS
jgi:hypothetical protein